MIFKPVIKDFSPIFSSNGQVDKAYLVKGMNSLADKRLHDIQNFDRLMQAYQDAS